MAETHNEDSPRKEPPSSGGYGFGTFGGVFLPNILSILGVILYLRSGWVLGQAGLFYTIIIVLLAHVVTITTGFSIAALSTNMTVKAGGAYYIISRSLGIEVGGCIGIPLALSQMMSVPFYIVGFVEAISPLLPTVPTWLLGGCALVLLAAVSLKGADIAIKAQYVVFFIIVLSLISLGLGSPLAADIRPVWSGSFADGNFWTVFAVFFPAVTGIMAGVSMSGDLKTPKQSIPGGTIGATFVGLAIYLIVMVMLSFYANMEQLANDTTVVIRVSRWPALIYAGIAAATLSSALGFLLGAPRTTQAVAADGILPRLLARQSGPNKDPIVALIFTLIISAVVLAMGELNAIASVLSMFFLATYGMLNMVAGLETLVDNPSYRPAIRVPWWVSILGAVSCFIVMFLINPVTTIIALGIVAIIFFVLKKRKVNAAWGDLRRGIWLALTRRSLLQMEQYSEHPKNWRPNIMVLTRIPQGRMDLVKFAHWFGQRSGVVTLRHIMVGPFEKMGRRRRVAINNLDRFISENNLMAFGAVDVLEKQSRDLRLVLLSQGYGTFRGNAVLIDWDERAESTPEEFKQLVLGVLQADKTLMLLREDSDRGFGSRDRIDVWAQGREEASVMLVLADLLRRNREWRDTDIRFFYLFSGEDATNAARGEADRLVDAGRVRCEITIVPQNEEIEKMMVEVSSATSLLICGFDPMSDGGGDPFDKMDRRLEQLPTTLLVKAAPGMDLLA